MDDEIASGREPSPLAVEIKDLSEAVGRAAAKRSRLPQPLFWSLFHSRIEELKRKKNKQRILDTILG